MNNTQLVAKSDSRTIEWLGSRGFTNPQHLPNDYVFPVFIVDLQSKTIFGTNTTCMAATCSVGQKPIALTLQELREKISV